MRLSSIHQFVATLQRRLALRSVPQIPVKARHILYSAILSLDDEPAVPTPRLMDLALHAAQKARTVSMSAVVERMAEPPYLPETWPGEHYKLLAGLVQCLKPRTVIEIGTATGVSALAMLASLPAGSSLATFDLVPWVDFPDTALRDSDFANGNLVQHLDNLAEPGVLERYLDLFQAADMIFIDGPKDGRFEQTLLDRLAETELPRRPILVLDDIRVWNMLAIWRRISKPKLDITSFGHWSGTGLVDWVRGDRKP